MSTPTARTKELDYNMKRPGTSDHRCAKCAKDLKPGAPFRMIHVVGGGSQVLHPEDESIYVNDGGDLAFFPIGPDCAKQLGLEWSWPQ